MPIATETDWPWMEVTRERMEEARDALADAGMEVGIEPGQPNDPRDTRVERWYSGAGLMGYKRVSGAYFLHARYMEPVEKTDLGYPEGITGPDPVYDKMIEEMRSCSGRQFLGMVKVCNRDFGGNTARMYAAIKELREEFGDELLDRVGAHLNMATHTFEEIRQQLTEISRESKDILDRVELPEPGSATFEEILTKYKDAKS